MKKLLFPLLMIMMIVSSCTPKAEEKQFLATDVDSVTIKDGSGSPVKVNVKFTLGYDSTAVINKMVYSEKELAEFVSRLYDNLKYKCNYPRTFKPVTLIGFNVLDTINMDGENVFHIEVLAKGVACNAYGVPSDVSDMLDLLAWKQILPPLSEEDTKEAIDEGENPYDYTYYWHVYNNEKYWIEQLHKDIAIQHNK